VKLKLDEHSKVCVKRPIKCPNNCSLETIPFCDLDDHLPDCPLELLSCPNGNDCLHDCPIKIYRKDYEEHKKIFKKRALQDDLTDMMYGFGVDWPIDKDALSLVEKLTGTGTRPVIVSTFPSNSDYSESPPPQSSDSSPSSSSLSFSSLCYMGIGVLVYMAIFKECPPQNPQQPEQSKQSLIKTDSSAPISSE
jgi:hypothetical protein